MNSNTALDRAFWSGFVVIVGAGAAMCAAEVARGADPDGLTVRRSAVTGLASFVTPRDGEAIPIRPGAGRAQATPLDFFVQHGALFGVTQPGDELRLERARTDALGHVHTTYRQVYRGVPVFTGELKVHQDAAGRIRAVNGDFFPLTGKLNDQPALGVEAAATIARAHLMAVSPTVANSELTIVDPGWYGDPPRGERLAWHLDLVDAARGVAEAFLIDAHNGEVLDQWSLIQHARDREIYDGGSGPGLPGVLVRAEGDPATGVYDEDAAYDYYGDTYDYFDRAFGRDGIDDAGLTMVATVDSTAPTCPNAFWTDFLLQMVFCDGTVTDDIVGHELTHGVTSFSNGLIYQNQPGQLNESFSDVFGEVIDLFNGDAAFVGVIGGPPTWPAHATGAGLDAPNNARSACSFSPAHADGVRWLVGEDALAFGGAIRDMWDPTCMGDPDRASSALQTCSNVDNGGVHSGSGVPNHAFAILTDGKSFNGYTVTGIGPIKAGAVWYRALTFYMTSGSDFEDAYWAFNQAAADLVGTTPNDPRTGAPSASAFTAADAIEVDEALLAVEMNTPGRCGDEPQVLDSTPPVECGAQIVIFDEDFESGLTGWSLSHSVMPTPYDWITTADLPFERAGSAAFGADLNSSCAYDPDETGVVNLDSPFINLPALLDFPTLAFTHFLDSEPNWDGGNVWISVNAGAWQLLPASAFYYNAYNRKLFTAGQGNSNPLAGQEAFTGSGGQWGTSLVYLGGLVSGGETIRIRFVLGKDGCTGIDGWYVDDVRVYDCSGAGDCNNNGIPDEVETAEGAQPNVVLSNPASHGNGYFTDVDLNPFGAVSVRAQRFTLFSPATIEQIRLWGGYYPDNTPPGDDFTVIFHADGGGSPGAAVSTQLSVPAVRTLSGFTIAGVDEWAIALDLAAPVSLGAGDYWVEIFNDTTGDGDTFFWSGSTYSSGLVGSAWAAQAPGVTWNTSGQTFNLAIEIVAGTIGADCNANGIPDECEPADDCNSNGVQDICDIASGTSSDCNANGAPDECEDSDDCNTNGVLDECDVIGGTSDDCNTNGALDECEVASPQGMYWGEGSLLSGTIWRLQAQSVTPEAVIPGISLGPLSMAVDALSERIYWSVGTAGAAASIRRASVDGSGQEDVIFSPPFDNPTGIAVDALRGKMYWIHDLSIYRANLDGSNIETVLTDNGEDCWVLDGGELALDPVRRRVYWIVGHVFGADLDGANCGVVVPNEFGLSNSRIAVDPVGAKLFVYQSSSNPTARRIIRTNMDGSGKQIVISSALGADVGIAIDVPSRKLYWLEPGGIYRSNLNGTGIENVLTGSWTNPRAFALHSSPVDCNANGLIDACEIADCAGDLACGDCDSNGVPDVCEYPPGDCDGNGLVDACELAMNLAADCNSNGVPDACDVDCNSNGVADECELLGSQQTAKIVAIDTAAGDNLGFDVAISGNTAIIGAHLDDDGASGSGSAYVFREFDGAWQQIAKLTAADGAMGDALGRSVAISDATAICGAFNDDDDGSNSGSAYVFREIGGVWQQIAKLTADDAAASDLFGNSVAISGNTAIVGAHLDDDGGSNSGSAYVFRENGGVWQQIAKLTAGDAAADDFFGFSVAISGTTAICGAYQDDDAGTVSGSAYVFREIGGVWQQIAKLTAADAAAFDRFGSSIWLSGSEAIIGAPWDTTGGAASGGSAYVFREVGGTWQQIAKLIPADLASGDNFGDRVAISGDTAIVGAENDDDSGTSSGSAYVFREIGGGWLQIAKLNADDAAANDLFGNGVAISENTAVIGAHNDDDDGLNSGSAYVFVVQAADCNGNGAPDDCDIAAGTSADCDDSLVPDACETFDDCNSSGVPDGCELAGNDCNSNGVPDECDPDCNANATPDDCEAFADCNTSGVPDECELVANDCNFNGVPDECDPDCNLDSVPDDCTDLDDCNTNGLIDECELAGNDCNSNGVLDVCELDGNDCNANSIPDDCELDGNDCNSNSIPDGCDVDCDSNGTPDDCEAFTDCNSNGIADECDIASGTSADANANDVPDECEPAEDDCNSNGIPDEEELVGPVKVYWTNQNSDRIQRANPDGTDVETLVTGLNVPDFIAVDPLGGKMYWSDRGTFKLQRANLDGSNVEDLLVPGLVAPAGVAVDSAGGKLYWTDDSTLKIQRANLDGTAPQDLVTTGLNSPRGLTLDVGAGKMYWTDNGANRIQRANLDGSNVENLVTIGVTDPRGIALDPADNRMYWVDNDSATIRRANLDGSNVQTIVVGQSQPVGLALDPLAGKIYWADSGLDRIQRANLDGSGIQNVYAPGTNDNPRGVAITVSAADCNGNNVPDECDTDCNTNGTPDDCEAFADCNASGVPDECELAGNDCNANGVPDECDADCNTNDTPDDCEAFTDCNANGTPDECEVIANFDFDADGDLDLDDYQRFGECLGGPGATPPVAPACVSACLSAFDGDADLDVDLQDASAFLEAFAP